MKDRTPQQHVYALTFDLAAGWKIYWRSPGDAGLPPELSWQTTENVQHNDNQPAIEMAWPKPHRVSLLGVETLAYGGRTTFPVVVTPENPDMPSHVRGEVNYLVCADICIPATARIEATLDPQKADVYAAEGAAQMITAAYTDIPQPSEAMRIQAARWSMQDGQPVIDLTFSLQQPATQNLDIFAEIQPSAMRGRAPVDDLKAISFRKPVIYQKTLADNGQEIISAHIPVIIPAWLAKPAVDDAADINTDINMVANVLDILKGQKIRFTAIDDQLAWDGVLVPGYSASDMASGAGQGASPADHSLLYMILVAIAGGLILNVMPCVLPVLSIKLIGILQHSDVPLSKVRLGFLASFAGIFVAFLGLAAALAGLKLAGASIGWGIQFQNPYFLVSLVLVLVLFAANLWGLYQFNLPQWVANMGGYSDRSHTIGGNFMAGLFATALATPCSAPLLGSAVGYALSRGVVEIGVIFAALGIGMGLPYLLVAIFPQLSRYLPKPGRWMLYVKYLMGVALFGTALWLSWVLVALIGYGGAMNVGLVALAMIAALAMRKRLSYWRGRSFIGIVLIALAVAAFYLTHQYATQAQQLRRAPDYAGIWHPFDQAKIATLVAQGKTVFVDVTADWCITCKVNKAAVLDQDPVHGRLQQDDIVPMLADWTRPSDTIAAFLAAHNRYGIPFNIVYGPQAPAGIPLPELLTDEIVLDALAQAAKNR
jgi:suppressor for copper-sensitivity B